MILFCNGDATGIVEVDCIIRSYINRLGKDCPDKIVFLQSAMDAKNLAEIGLQGDLIQQLPEFVYEIALQSGVLYHMFLLYNNESGVHIFSLRDTLDTDSEKFLADERFCETLQKPIKNTDTIEGIEIIW